MVDIDTNSRAFKIGEKIGSSFMTYIIVSLIIKGTKIIIKSGRVLLNSSMPTP